jgi:WD repeat-containing protein 48
MLNDRMHVLTVDTSGEVMVWDIVRGVCKGVFGREEVSAATATAGSVGGSHGGSVSGGSIRGTNGRRGGNHNNNANGVKEGGREKGNTMEGDGEEREKEKSPREMLEAVRERIEGEAVIQSWCSTDTKAGVLVVRVSERCFEAEVYADEIGFGTDRHFNEESKREFFFSSTIIKLMMVSKYWEMGFEKPVYWIYQGGAEEEEKNF